MIRDRAGGVIIGVRYHLVWKGDSVAEYPTAKEGMEACDKNPGSRLESEVFTYEGQGEYGNREVRLPRHRVYP